MRPCPRPRSSPAAGGEGDKRFQGTSRAVPGRAPGPLPPPTAGRPLAGRPHELVTPVSCPRTDSPVFWVSHFATVRSRPGTASPPVSSSSRARGRGTLPATRKGPVSREATQPPLPLLWLRLCRSFGPLHHPAPSARRGLRAVGVPGCHFFVSCDTSSVTEAPAAWRPGAEEGEASPQRGVTSVSGRLAWAGPPPHPTPPHRTPAPASGRARACPCQSARAHAPVRAGPCARTRLSVCARLCLCVRARLPVRVRAPAPAGGGALPPPVFPTPSPSPIPSPPPLAPQPPLTAPLTLLSAALCSLLPILFLPLPPLTSPPPPGSTRAWHSPPLAHTPPFSASLLLRPALSRLLARSLARSLSTLGSPLFSSLVPVRSPPFLRLLSSLSCSALAFSSRPWPSSPSFSVAVPVPPRPLPLSPPCVSAFLPRLASRLPVRSSAPHPPLLSRTVFCPRPSSPVRSLPLPTLCLHLSPSFSFPRRRSPRHRLPSPRLSLRTSPQPVFSVSLPRAPPHCVCFPLRFLFPSFLPAPLSCWLPSLLSPPLQSLSLFPLSPL
ncbi:extensin-like [Prionailurus bengalensis]|uniref:extensin-like n=1 Tax=Prionailurus bengalensis TaxID=37029 RepID=UPI001CA8ACAA|nr:extensin-like [Prionailurus bengalensis]